MKINKNSVVKETNIMKGLIASLLIVYFTLSLFGCETGRGTGALAGGAIGAGVGAAVSKHNRLAGALIGGALGAIAGAAVGNYIDEQKKNRQESVRDINYRPSQGNIVQIEQSNIDPVEVKPGDTVGLKTSYYVISPSPGQVKIIESRVIKYNGEPVMEPLVREVRKEQGLTSSTVKLPIPNDASEGEYTVITTIDNGAKREQAESKFYVQKI
jgi:hypothetical protein